MEKQRFTGNTRTFLLISVAIMVVALILSLCGMGMNMGIDFTGGSLLRYEMGQDYDVNAVEGVLKDLGVTESQIAKAGDGDVKTEVQIRLKLVDDSETLRSDLEHKLKEIYPELSFINIEHVGAVAGQDLIRNAVMSMLIVFACLLIYIGIRFDFASGLAALVALVHDVLIMVSFMVFFSSLYQVNSSFIAALLTIVGYSINNTIVIFDRIRETSKRAEFRAGSKQAVVEYSVGSTLSRTINTTLTTLLTLVTLYILGVTSIREFAFPLIVGMLAGTYSSVLLSGQIWAHWMDHDSFHKVKAIFKKA